jgi:hypothetical protein
MADDSDHGAGESDFASYAGELELDLERPTSLEAPPPSRGSEGRDEGSAEARPTPPGVRGAPAALGPSAGRAPNRPGLTLPRPSAPPAGGGGLLKKLVVLVFVGAIASGGYWLYCGFEVRGKLRAFSALASGLKQALPLEDEPIDLQDVRDVVLEFAREAEVELQQLETTFEPLTAETLPKLPSVDRMALGFASQVPNHRLPYSVVGFEATVIARHGWAQRRGEARRYTWLDQPHPDAPEGAGGGSVGGALEQQMKERLQRALGEPPPSNEGRWR